MDCKKKENIIHAIEKTGFVFENKISLLLEKKNWYVIRNRYYVDAQTNNPREVDILAYKTFINQNIRFYFVLLISCKKSSSNDWVFLTSQVKNNVNFDLFPQLVWSNSKIIEATKFSEKLSEEISKNILVNPFKELFGLDNNVFPFQEVCKENSTPKNDTNIYSSIDSILKASKYEIQSCGKRKKNQVVYHYNLLTVFDGELFEMFINDDTNDVIQRNHLKYVNRFIVGSEDSFYRFHFTNGEYLPTLLDYFDLCIEKEKIILNHCINDFKDNFSSNLDYIFLYREELKQCLLNYINYSSIDYPNYRNDKINELWLAKSEKENTISIQVCMDKDEIELLNRDTYLIERAKEAMKKYYYYSGEVEFVTIPDEMPF